MVPARPFQSVPPTPPSRPPANRERTAWRKVAEAEDETKKLGFQIQIRDGDKLAKNSIRLGDLSGRKLKGGGAATSPAPDGKRKKGCLIALLLAPLAPWL